MTPRRRTPPPEEPTPRPEPAAGRGVWLIRGGHIRQPGVVWLKRPMPPDQWPPDQRQPRDNTFRWWIRAHCGHPGGARQFAFYEEKYADEYEHVFRDDPCRWTRCDTGRRAEGRW